MGSRVPAWPTRFWPEARLIRATISYEVQPEGLRTLIIPFTFFISSNAVNQLFDMGAPLDGIIPVKA